MTARLLLVAMLVLGVAVNCSYAATTGRIVRAADDRNVRIGHGDQHLSSGGPGKSRNRMRMLNKGGSRGSQGTGEQSQSEWKVKGLYDQSGNKRSFQKQSSKRKLATTKRRDSDIYFVKLPPAPYTYIEGLGYVSRGPSFTSGSLAFHRPHFVRPPVDFVSNGKPIGVYRWTAPDSPVVKLDRGPYLFNGKPRGDVFDGNNRPNDLLK